MSELLEYLKQAVMQGEEEQSAELVGKALEAGISPGPYWRRP